MLLVPLLLATLLLSASPAHAAAVSLGVSPIGPSLVTVGQTGLPAQLSITNSSFDVGPVTLTQIVYNPSCGDFTLSCSSPELGVFSLSPTATGTSGACAGQTFTVSGPDGTGRFTFAPATQVVLQPTGANSSCVISFTFSVLKVPTIDSLPGTPGVQTTRFAMIAGTAQATGGATVNGTATGSASITVVKVQPTMVTQVSSASVTAGTAVTDTAALTGSAGVPITGTVTFRAYGPADPSCSSAPVFTSSSGVGGNTATSGSFTPLGAGTYRFVATYNGDVNNNTVAGFCNDPNETVTVSAAGTYKPLTPARILDTRDGTGGISAAVGPGATVTVQVTGRGGVPASGVSAVAMNVTVTQPTGDGFLTLYPTGTPRPLAANLNFTPGKTVPNLVVVKLGTGGQVDMFNSAGSTHVIYDVAGYFTDTPVGNDGRYTPLNPLRILDTRLGIGGSSVRLGPGASLDLQVAGQGGVPAAGVEAVVMNVAVTNTTGTSFLTVYPTGEARPLAANLNWVAGDTVSNRVIAKLGSSGRVTLYNNAGQTDLIVDVNGWFTDPTVAAAAGTFSPVTPARILDTRTGIGGVAGPIAGGSTVDVQVTGVGGVPASGVSAVILNATVVGPAGTGFLTLFPAGTGRPVVSDLNYAAGEIRPNLVVVKVGAGGKVSLFPSSSTHVVFDVAGWFT